MAVKLTPRVLERMGVPRELWRARADEIQHEDVHKPVVKFLKQSESLINSGKGLLLMGGPGVGKSAIAAMVSKQARLNGFTVYFTSPWEIRNALWAKVPFAPGVTTLDRAKSVDLFVLDGLTREDASERVFGWSEIRQLLTSRVNNKASTIITTQLSAGELDATFQGALDLVRGCMVGIKVLGENKRTAEAAALETSIFG